MHSLSEDETGRPNCRRCSFLALTHGSPTFKDALDAQRALPKLGLRVSEAATLSLDDTLKSSIESQCKKFNRYAQYLGANAASDVPWETADTVQDTLTEIEQILVRAADSIQEKASQLEHTVKQFTLDVSRHADPKWYRHLPDLTALDDTKLAETLNKMPLGDVGDFAAYLKETLPPAARSVKPNHEFFGRTFTGKVHLLLERTLQESRADYSVALSLFAVVRAKILLPGLARVHPRNLERERQYVDETLLWLLEQHSSSADEEQYWDIASSWRMLVHGWEGMADDPGSLLRLLDPIRAKAQSEIRYRVNIAVGDKLPAELSDAVFEQAMLSEEVAFDE